MICTHRTSTAAALAASLLLATPIAASTVVETTVERSREAPRNAAPWSAAERQTADPAMPAMLRLAMIRSRAGEVGFAYHVDGNGRGANPRHGLELAFTPPGAWIDGPAGGFALYLERFGHGDGRPVRRAAPRIDGAWVEYDRGAGLTEWFVNLPGGVEQGWTVAERPAGGGPLVLELDTARPPEASDDRRLAWSGLVYHRLVALDADGRELPAVWATNGTRLRIEVDDRDAVYPVLIDPWVEKAKFTAEDGAAGDLLGWSVALADDTAMVGARLAFVDGKQWQGALYVFKRVNGVWSQQAKLTADDGTASDEFGSSVALEGNTALVGAPVAEADGVPFAGKAYVFTESGGVWSQQAKLTPDDGVMGERFGYSVALSGDTALVGARFAEVQGNPVQGAAYVFTNSGGVWSQKVKLTADDGITGDEFGFSVALADDTALVGARSADVDGNLDQGAAYVFTEGDEVWSQQAKLTADDGAAGEVFGFSVALAGDTALVGAENATVDGHSTQGAAYVFTESDGVWSQQAELTPDNGVAGEHFGHSVALAGDDALIGAFAADVAGNDAQGAAYVFTRSGGTWRQQVRLTSADGDVFDQFGSSVALEDGTALVGAYRADVSESADQGAAYLFVRPLLPVALEVDVEPRDSDGNGVFEPGEEVEVVPAWRNEREIPLDVTSMASSFTGPPGATYEAVLLDADYGTLAPGATASCRESGVCFALEVDAPVSRPVSHWDSTLDELLTLIDPDGTVTTTKPWTLHVGDSFTDVPRTHLFYSWIETVLHLGVTAGCGESEYCPLGTSTRGQMPVFVLRAFLGPEFMPEPCVAGQERFADVPAGHLFCPWIEELAERGVVSGCGGDNYCPDNPVTRAQMAIFLLKTLEGPNYTPPECSGVFADVDCPSIFADWVEELYNRGVTTGCTVEPLNYCPNGTNIRGQMAVFLGETFGLTLYGP